MAPAWRDRSAERGGLCARVGVRGLLELAPTLSGLFRGPLLPLPPPPELSNTPDKEHLHHGRQQRLQSRNGAVNLSTDKPMPPCETARVHVSVRVCLCVCVASGAQGCGFKGLSEDTPSANVLEAKDTGCGRGGGGGRGPSRAQPGRMKSQDRIRSRPHSECPQPCRQTGPQEPSTL